MHTFQALFTNYWLMSTVSGWLLAQMLKVATGIFKERDFSIRSLLFGTGGMPSSHTASVSALCTSVALTEGFASPIFAVTALLTIIVMNDAVGVRRETGEQSKALNLILDEWFQDKQPENAQRHFKELIGHTPLQVFFGMLTGIGAAFLLTLIPAFGGILL